MAEKTPAKLFLEDGSIYHGSSFGYEGAAAGEVVFNTGMVGYPESFTDPSYYGQILCMTYPMIGNYGVPGRRSSDSFPFSFESSSAKISGLVVSEYSRQWSHHFGAESLGDWLKAEKIPAIEGIDTRALTMKLRSRGVMLGKIVFGGKKIPFADPNKRNLVAEVSCKEPVFYPAGRKTVAVVDCGAKNNIFRSLLSRNLSVLRVPWDYDLFNGSHGFDGVLFSNGPGDPKTCGKTIELARASMEQGLPSMGICLGSQIMALAVGADTYKMKYGHRSQNQPCLLEGSRRCFITSQNHGYAVDEKTLPRGWKSFFRNTNDGSNEGIRHARKPFFAVQFHPEASPGPVDTGFLFDDFKRMVFNAKK